MLTPEEIEGDYEGNTGKAIVRSFKDKEYQATPVVLVAAHGPFSWGKTPAAAVENACILEEVANQAPVLPQEVGDDEQEIGRAHV